MLSTPQQVGISYTRLCFMLTVVLLLCDVAGAAEYIDGPINLCGLEGEVDVMIESKGKEMALLEYRQYIIDGRTVDGPRTVRAAKFAADAAAAAADAAAAAEEESDSEEADEYHSTTDDE